MSPYRPNSLESRTGSPIDAGAVDNRLSLDPNDPNWKDTIADWQDGESYTLSVSVTQISPGEFEVQSVSAEAAPEDEALEEDEPQPLAGAGGPNQAVRNMMLENGA